MKTTTELATSVLRHLSVIDATESGDSEDITLIQDAYTDKWAELSAHGLELTYWPLAEIPEAVFTIMRDLVALEVMPAFGQPINAADKMTSETIILKKLRRHVHTPSSNLPTYTDYF